MLDRLQAATLQAEGDGCAGFSGPPVNSCSRLSIPSLRNESLLLTTLKGRSVEDEITDGKRSGLQPGGAFLEEAVLKTDIGLKSFSGDVSFATSTKSIFEDLSPSTVPGRNKFTSSLESMDQLRVDFREQGGLKGKEFKIIFLFVQKLFRLRQVLLVSKTSKILDSCCLLSYLMSPSGIADSILCEM